MKSYSEDVFTKPDITTNQHRPTDEENALIRACESMNIRIRNGLLIYEDKLETNHALGMVWEVRFGASSIECTKHVINLSLAVLYETVRADWATGSCVFDVYRRCSRRSTKTVECMLSENFFSRYYMNVEDFLDRLVTGDKTWVVHVNVVINPQSMVWCRTDYKTLLRKTQQTLSSELLMVTVIWDSQEILLI
ncbi:histone-lysine N-methyltransferase SETMAR [Trichonephila clavipes]|nr:histone-lysine N-methyltransferase SETMAR [Trichonephila clavipes]